MSSESFSNTKFQKVQESIGAHPSFWTLENLNFFLEITGFSNLIGLLGYISP